MPGSLGFTGPAGALIPSPPIVQKLLVEIHPLVAEKDKSIHSLHGVIHYPLYLWASLRLQTHHYEGPQLGMFGIWSRIWKTEGVPGLWKGLSASLTRTFFYSGIRFGMYEKLKEMSTTPTHAPAAGSLAVLAATSGACGSVASNFADVVCLRMQNDPGVPLEKRRNYNNIAHGLVKMIRTEGWGSIWTGVGIGAGRSAVATATQLAGYDVIKRELMRRTSMKDDIPTHITGSCLAGFLSTFICSPLDVFKARIMTRTTAHDSMGVMLRRIFKNEGPTWMFRGLTPALISRAPSTIITFVIFEQLKAAYRRLHGLEE
ncbi:mitochondrial carrier domain-containing protein [Delphinella strobiligena]|nr:mitochondrial carrier domain-containing protein [Delphinella strobiligena]